MSQRKNVVFDFGGVLVDWDPWYCYRNVFSQREEMERFFHIIDFKAWNAEQDRGRPYAEGISLLLSQHPEYAAEIRLLRDGWEEMLGGEIPAAPTCCAASKPRVVAGSTASPIGPPRPSVTLTVASPSSASSTAL